MTRDMLSNAFVAAAGLLLVAALTPGPNNFVVLRAAAGGGVSAAWPAILGVVSGGIVMLGFGVLGLATVFSQWPFLRVAIATGGAAYLCWLAIGLMRTGTGDGGHAPLPTGAVGLFVFQFLNPKGWVMVLSVVSAFPPLGMSTTFIRLAPAFLLIPTACLWLWAIAGRYLATHVREPVVRRRIDRVMGMALLVNAVLLLP